MDPILVDSLACTRCAGSFVLADVGLPSDEVENGRLQCTSCSATYPIARGIPRLLPEGLSGEQRRTAEAFGWQWLHFPELKDAFEAQFLDWIDPIEPTFFAAKDVLDAGCGIGRHAYLAAGYGVHRLIALDLSAAVEPAADNLERFDNAHVIQGDILRLPLRTPEDGGGFDLIYSIGVLHHLPDPRAGFLSLARWLRPGGTIAVWVYGHENNGFVRHVIEPLRRFTTSVPPSFLRAIAWPLALMFHAVVKGVYAPTRRHAWAQRLPLRDYLSSLGTFGFRQNYTIVFDQLVAPTAAYVRGDEVREWFEAAGLVDVHVTSRHGNSWRGHGRRPTDAPPNA